jgi:hypothetical protein
MKTIKLLTILLTICIIPFAGIAQDSTSVKLDKKAKLKLELLEQKLQQIETEEKAKLKKIIAELNVQQAEDSIYSKADFEAIKMENAKRTAENIANRQEIIKNQIDFLKRNGYVSEEANISMVSNNGEDGVQGKAIISSGTKSIEITESGIDFSWQDEDDEHYRNSTQKDIFIAYGLNNAIPSEGGFNETPFKIAGSRFFEIGVLFSTPITKSNFMRLDYGLSFQFNGLKPEDNLIYFEDGDQTVLDRFEFQGEEIDFRKNKFRQDNLIFPVHLHFNTKKSKKGDYFTRSGFNFGMGGFVGLNLNNITKLKFDAPDGGREKLKFRDDYNTNNFLYGLSAYAGFGDATLYMTYSLNPIFKDNPVELNNVQLGFRFAF